MITEISSHANPRFKALKALAKSRSRKSDRHFVIEGVLELGHALRSGLRAKAIWFSPYYASERDFQAWDSSLLEVYSLSKALFEEVAFQHASGNFIVVVETWETNLASLPEHDTIVVLERVEKPGNLGAILRTCDAAGVKGVIVCNTDMDIFNANVIRNSRGALFSLKCASVTNEEAHAYLRAEGYSIYCAGLVAGAENYHIVQNPSKKALVFGPESTGLSSFWLEKADHIVLIPMRGHVDSLNLSVSVGILLYTALAK